MRALVIDDDFIALNKVRDILLPYGECDAATHGRQAIMMFCKALSDGRPYDLLTMDIEMPVMTGLELLQTLRQKEDLKQIPRAKKIMISGSSSRSNVFKAIENHCDAFLVKPVTAEALLRTLGRLGFSLQKDPHQSERARPPLLKPRGRAVLRNEAPCLSARTSGQGR